MADSFALTGEWSTTPTTGAPSADPSLVAPISETASLAIKHTDVIELAASASAQAVQFGGVASAHVVIIRTVGGRVDVRITHAGGSTQIIPVDALLILTSTTRPITAINLTEPDARAKTVKVFLGEE